MLLCNDCKNFDLQAFRHLPDRCIALSYGSIEASSKAGCDFCSFILTNANEYIGRMDSSHRYPWIRLSLIGDYDSSPNQLLGCHGLQILVSNSRLAHKSEKVNDPAASTYEFCVVAKEGKS